jgi:hypothetical protein
MIEALRIPFASIVSVLLLYGNALDVVVELEKRRWYQWTHVLSSETMILPGTLVNVPWTRLLRTTMNRISAILTVETMVFELSEREKKSKGRCKLLAFRRAENDNEPLTYQVEHSIYFTVRRKETSRKWVFIMRTNCSTSVHIRFSWRTEVYPEVQSVTGNASKHGKDEGKESVIEEKSNARDICDSHRKLALIYGSFERDYKQRTKHPEGRFSSRKHR